MTDFEGATPRPWAVEEVGAGELFIVSPDGQGGSWPVCEMSKDNDWSNANLIVTAVNLLSLSDALAEAVHGERNEHRIFGCSASEKCPWDERVDAALSAYREAAYREARKSARQMKEESSG